VFRSNGAMQVVKIENKVFVGKNIIHCAVFKKKDERTIYNMIYKDGKSGNTMIKRFPVKSITRNKEYMLTKSEKGNKVLYFTSNPNGEAECVVISLKKLNRIKNLKIDVDFAAYIIKGKEAKGNILTKYPVRKVELKSLGVSTLSARKIWFDESVNKLNADERGSFLGEFKAKDKILTAIKNGKIELKSFELSNHFRDDLLIIEKYNPNKPVSVIYYEGNKKTFFVKRFLVPNNISHKIEVITSHKDSYLELITTDWRPQIEVIYVKQKGKDRQKEIFNLEQFISIKGIKTQGNKLTNKKIKEINLLAPLPYIEDEENKKNIDDINNPSSIELKITNSESENDQKGQISLEL
jgi:topoisomerase-4 subunit A